MPTTDDMQNDRIESMDARLRGVEQAVVELGAMAKWLKYGVMVIAASFGVDVSGMI